MRSVSTEAAKSCANDLWYSSAGAETGVRRVQTTATPTERFARVKRVVVEIEEPIPVTEAEVDFLLHWAGDLAADLMNDDDVGG